MGGLENYVYQFRLQVMLLHRMGGLEMCQMLFANIVRTLTPHGWLRNAIIDGQLHRVKLTVKDYVLNDGQARKNLHAIEAVEIENALLGTLPSDENQGIVQPTTGHGISVADLLGDVKRDGDGLAFGTSINQANKTHATAHSYTA